jgi:TP901 family phage tail tape measure protein
MSNEITSTLGFDASQALATLKKLDSQFQSTATNAERLAQAFGTLNSAGAQVPANLAQLTSGAQNLSGSLGKLPNAANAAKQSLANVVGPQVQQQFAAATAQTQRFDVSLRTLGRIAFTQIAIKSLRLLEQNFVDAGKSAAEFQKRMAEVQSLSNGAFSLDSAGKQVRKVSDQFGHGLDDTGTALREIVGAQIGNGDPLKQVEVLTEAAALAKSGISTLAESSALLSTILNGFGKDTAEVGDIASKAFKATDLGVLTIGQLEHSIGRVIPTAKLLGVSMEEVLAAFSTLTRNGVNPSEAATQIGGAMTALLKPTDSMKGALKELGVEGSQALIASKGFASSLESIIGTTDGSAESISKLFTNVRGLNGAIKLGSQNIKDFRSDLSQIKGVSPDLSRQQGAAISSVDGDRVAKEIRKISNAVTIDLGQSILKTTVAISDFVGGADTVTAAMAAMGPAALGAGAGLAILAARSKLGVSEGTLLYGVLGKMSLALVAFGAAATGGEFLGNALAKNLFGDFQKRAEENIASLQRFKDLQQSLVSKHNQTRDDQLKSAIASGEPVDLAALSKAANRPITKQSQVPLAGKEAIDRAAVFEQIIASANTSQQKIVTLQDEIRRLDTQSAGALGTLGKLFSGFDTGNVEKEIQNIRDEILRLASSSQITDDDLSRLEKRSQALQKLAGATPATKLGFAAEAESSAGAIQRLRTIQSLQKQNPGLEQAKQGLAEINAAFSNLPIASFTEMQRAFGGSAVASEAIAGNLERAAAAARQAAAAQAAGAGGGGGGGGGEELWRGGKPRYFADGGPVGSDRIPAWLSAGESVNTRAATSKFYSQISAMNAGHSPTAASAVGDTNIDVGGITVNGGQTNGQTASVITSALRREFRRGASRPL